MWSHGIDMTQIGVILYDVADLGQLDCSKWVRQVKCPYVNELGGTGVWSGKKVKCKNMDGIIGYLITFLKLKWKNYDTGTRRFCFYIFLVVTLWQNGWCSQMSDYWIVSVIEFAMELNRFTERTSQNKNKNLPFLDSSIKIHEGSSWQTRICTPLSTNPARH